MLKKGSLDWLVLSFSCRFSKFLRVYFFRCFLLGLNKKSVPKIPIYYTNFNNSTTQQLN